MRPWTRPAALLLISLTLAGCGGGLEQLLNGPKTESAYAKADPTDYFEVVGPFKAGQFTLMYCPVELYNEAGERQHPPVRRADRKALMEKDRAFMFEIKPSPLQGLGGQVNFLLARDPCKVTVNDKGLELLDAGSAKASDVVDIWRYHEVFEGLATAHPGFFGPDPQLIYQIPHGMRDQATWFRFDRVASLAEATMSTFQKKEWAAFGDFVRKTANESEGSKDPRALFGRLMGLTSADKVVEAAFPKLSVPLIWHPVGGGRPGISLKPKFEGVPSSSVVLFHELGHIGTCRAADGYSEASASAYLDDNPREAAVVEFLGRTVSVSDVGEAVGQVLDGQSFLPGALKGQLAGALKGGLSRFDQPDRKYNVSSILLRNTVSKRAVGKVLGEPNVLPDDPEIIKQVWGAIPGFTRSLWTEEAGRAPKVGDVRVVRGGLYLEKQAFARLQVFERGEWRDTYMADSHNPEAPVGPVLEACLGKLAERIRGQ